MMIEAIASPFTNFIAPSRLPWSLLSSLQRPAFLARLVLAQDARSQVAVDRQLLAGHRVEAEPRGDFGDALGASSR